MNTILRVFGGAGRHACGGRGRAGARRERRRATPREGKQLFTVNRLFLLPRHGRAGRRRTHRRVAAGADGDRLSGVPQSAAPAGGRDAALCRSRCFPTRMSPTFSRSSRPCRRRPTSSRSRSSIRERYHAPVSVTPNERGSMTKPEIEPGLQRGVVEDRPGSLVEQVARPDFELDSCRSRLCAPMRAPTTA